jgi:dihydrolipoamide dehydrogenase
LADYDLIVLGSGVGGYVAAIRAGQLGMKTAVVEKDENVGGVCLNWGCIPSKSLLRNAEVLSLIKDASEWGVSFDNLQYDFGKAVDRSRKVVRRLTNGVGFLLKKNNVEVIKGTGSIKAQGTIAVEETGASYTTNNIIIATGARARELPNIPVDGKVVVTSRDAIVMKEAPSKVVIIGGGAIGVEFADIYHAYGADVTIVELLPRLVPLEDEDMSKQLERSFKRKGINFMTDSKVDSVTVDGEEAKVTISNGSGTTEIDCDRVLVSIGVVGNVENIGLEALGVAVERGRIIIDDEMKTNVPGIYAIGDVSGKLPLAHVASAQGVTAVEVMAGMNPPTLDYTVMPRATYCRPQIASMGLTEAQAREQGYSVRIGQFPFSASGKAMALNEVDGMAKLVVDEEVGEIIGAHIIGPEATELLGEIGMTKLLEGTTAELGWLVHPHPTISEAIKEAALAADGQAINI